jgi:hypothetical protein
MDSSAAYSAHVAVLDELIARAEVSCAARQLRLPVQRQLPLPV